MKKIFTLIIAVILVASASQNNAAVITSGTTTKPIVTPNPAHDYLKVSWQMTQADNVTISLYYSNGNLARTLTNRSYSEGNYTEMFKLGVTRGVYFVRITIGYQPWSYKLLVQ